MSRSTTPWFKPIASALLFKMTLVGFALTMVVSSPLLAQRNLKDIPDPDPELERKTFIVPEGFEVNLYAADPRIAKPIQMNFDEQGRLWVASSEVYPHIKPGQKATDKILVLEDKDQDGKADRTTIFANGLLIPTGVLPGDGGAYVVNSTELLHLEDTNGDGSADAQRVVLSGFGTEDTHHLLHTLRWGHDGAMYMNQSIYIHSHVETPYGVRRLNGGGIWRFRPDTLQLDPVCYGFVNPWGHHFDHWGQQFATDGAYGEGINYVFPGAVYVTAPGAKRRLKGLNPGSPKHCGLEIASGSHLPDDWQGSMLTNDFRAHRVCRFVVTEDGSGYQSRQEVELIKSTHVAFRPIDVKVGPDGAIYVADWYNPIIQHGEVDFRDPRRDHVHGRIWRISAKDRDKVAIPQYAKLSALELTRLLARSEEWIRLHAKRELSRRDSVEVRSAISQWLSETKGDEAHLHHQLEALWLCQMRRDFKVGLPMLESLLACNDHRARSAAVRVAVHWQAELDDPFSVFARGVADEHPRVRLESVRALSTLKTYESAAAALTALDQPMDRFLDFALWQAMRDLEPFWLPLVRDGKQNFDGNVKHLSFALQAVDSPDVAKPLMEVLRTSTKLEPARLAPMVDFIGSIATAEQYAAVLDEFASDRWNDQQRATGVLSVAASAAARKIKPAGDQAKRIASWLESEDKGLRRAALRAVGAMKTNGLLDQVVQVAQGDDVMLRDAALQALVDLQSPQARQALMQQAKEGGSEAHRAAAIRSLASIAPRAAASEAIALLQTSESADPAPLVSALMARKDGPKLLVEGLKGKQVPASMGKKLLRAARASGAKPDLVSAIRAAGGLEAAKWKATPELIQALAAESREQGDPHRGQAIYRRRELQCAKCHAVGGSGGRVGPDLISIGASAQPDYLVESLLAPSAKVKENFHSLLIQTDDGVVISGVVVRKSDKEIVLRDKDDKEVTVLTEEIVSQKEGRSLMPEGTVDELTRQELVDLVRFLSEIGKVGEFAVPREQYVRTWRVLLPTPEAYHRIRRTSYDTAASDDPALTFEPAYSQVNGELPLDGLPGFLNVTYVTRKQTSPTTFVRCRMEVTQPGRVALAFNGVEGLTLWVNGKPTPIDAAAKLNWKAGQYDLTVAINREQRTKALRVQLLDEGTSASIKLIGGK